jgi:hypothetical protein
MQWQRRVKSLVQNPNKSTTGAGCINKECKDNAVKITKGEFRYAIQVTIKEHQSWQYKHW